MKPKDVSRVFQSEDYKAAAEKGPVIGLEFNSKDCVRVTNEAVRTLFGDTPSTIYVSPNPEKASQDIDAFYNFVDMSMTYAIDRLLAYYYQKRGSGNTSEPPAD